MVVQTRSRRPDPVRDLCVTARAGDRITLAWTATGDDGGAGRPARYLIRAADY